MSFLVHDATAEELKGACVHNHLVWLRRLAEAGGGDLFDSEDLEWAATWQPGREVTVAVKRTPDEGTRRRIDEIGEYCRANLVDVVSYWALDEAYAKPLDVWLCARGLRPGGRPHWMALDLRKLSLSAPSGSGSDEYRMTLPDSFDDHTSTELLCYHPASKTIRETLLRRHPDRVWHVVWWRDGAPVGNVSVNISDGDLGVAGIHDLYFLSSARVAGLGLDRFDEVVAKALEIGCRYGIANAADEAAPLYRVMGFQSLGFGRTWWLPRHAVHSAPDPKQVAFAEAIGEGDLDAMREWASQLGDDASNRPLANGMTPLRLAAHHGGQEAARWLLDRGAELDLLSFWELGWREEVRERLRRDGSVLRRRLPYTGKTLLHAAVQRDDADLAALLLECGADPQIRDGRYDSTPLDWAVELRRSRIALMLRRHARERALS